MRKLVAGFIFIMALPMAAKAQAPGEVQRPENVPGESSETLPSGSSPSGSLQEPGTEGVDTESEAYKICMRATKLFEQQERAKGKAETAEAPITASCKTELKPASYWNCMEQEAIQKVDFNTAHWSCAKQTKILEKE
jgi:hypothetical protein